MPSELYEFVYAVEPIGQSGNWRINPAGTSTTGNVTFTDADNTMTAGDTFTYNATSYTFSGTGGSPVGYFATSGGTTYFFSHTAIGGSTNIGAINTAGSEVITCFTAGTLILCEHGEVPVENLKAGDLVRTAAGALRSIKWIGEQRISLLFISRDRSLPVKVKAGALGDNRPSRDLVVSPGHAILVDGVLCNAAALINGTTIVRAEQAADFTYYHVELDSHDLLVSEGVASESYLCTLDRNMFHNAGTYEQRFGADMMPHLSFQVQAQYVLAKI